jgi:hypothetical protein
LYCVVCPEGYFYVGLFEEVGDECGFITDVSENGPFWCWILCVCGLGLFFVVAG